jgi:probable rRNA maturation factor
MMLDIAIDADAEWDSSSRWEVLVREAAEAAIAESAFPQLTSSTRPVELSVRLTSDSEMQALNSTWRGKDQPTNVLSFPQVDPGELGDIAADGPDLMLGDVVLAHGTCAREAEEKAIPFKDHAAHLVVHGTLHLLGYDHGGDDEAEAMERREARALARIGIADPYAQGGL